MIRLHTSRLIAFAAVVTLALVAAPGALAQRQRAAPTPNDTLKSVEVSADRKVTFRIYAPKASNVSVAGDFALGGPLTKNEEGVWSRTVGPLAPDYYGYLFTVDGVRTVDPKSPIINFSEGGGSVWGAFLVPGSETDFEAAKDVPHGDLRTVWYRSGTLDSSRRLHVYMPPGYEGGIEKYPVLYLLHGSGGNDGVWSMIGRAGFILDNLIAAKKAVPMIVVMPNVNVGARGNLPRRAPGAPASPELRAAMAAGQNRFTDELMKEIIPFIEKTYRVKGGPEHRAIAGLSMGGGRTLAVIVSHPDQFSYVAVWSAALFTRGNPAEFEKRYEPLLNAAEQVNKTVKLFSISVGDKDSLLDGSKALAALLEKHGIKHEMHISGGGHTWINWRHYLNALAPRLFVGIAGPVSAQSTAPAKPDLLVLHPRSQVEVPEGSGRYQTAVKHTTWDPKATAVIVCDMWDLHWSNNATLRVREMAPRMDRFLAAVRARGGLIIHAPSSCMEVYKDHPARKRALATPLSKNLPPDIGKWCYQLPSETKGTYPIPDQKDDNDDDPAPQEKWTAHLAALGRHTRHPWQTETDLLRIDPAADVISDRGDEIWSILEHRKISHVILMGVHMNMCVLGRPFACRQMARNGKDVVLCRDLTDPIYNPKRPPYVGHFAMIDLMVDHIERYICPTITSDQVLGGSPFRFKDDPRGSTQASVR